jgi:GntP family gluconate:H+ symporter
MRIVMLLLISVAFIIVTTTKLKLHPFLALLLAALLYGVLCGTMTLEQVVKSINSGFGGTVGDIGIVILAGSVIGTFLEKSGGALKLADATLAAVGRRNVPLAMAVLGYIVSIPVFCDSAFVILCPLAKALSRKVRISLAASIIALSLGLLATHSMVPPTPGPVAAAGMLEADLGRVILFGLLTSLVALAAGWLFAAKFAARTYISPDSEPAEELSQNVDTEAPSAFKSVVPILLPIVLIVLSSICKLSTHPFGQGKIATIINFLGQPIVAMLIGVFFAFLLPRRLTTEMLSTSGWVGHAVINAAAIIIITGCGGAFARVLKDSGISDVVGETLGNARLGIWLPFLIAMMLKNAQGSGTVAIITTAGIMSPLMSTLGFESAAARALIVVAIGAGSMSVSHTNDSYFWIVTQLSGMTVQQGFKLHTLGTLVLAAASAVVVFFISLFVL